MKERFPESNSRKFTKFATSAVRGGLVAGVAAAGALGIVGKVEGPKEDDGDVAASRFVMTPPGAQKWVEINAFEEAFSDEVERNLLKMGEKFKVEWYEEEIPVAVSIPSLGIESLLIKTEKIPDPNKPGLVTFATPDFGIAVPGEMIKNGRHANVFIYEHSQMYGKHQPFRGLTNLNFGDTATIVSPEGKYAEFKVEAFKLLDYADSTFVIDKPDSTVVTFQTTAMVGNAWLVEESNLEGKVDLPTETSGHLALQVVLVPMEE